MIAPDEDQYNQLKAVAEKGEAELQKLRDANKVSYVRTRPATVGGAASLEEVRQKQQADYRMSKGQKKLQRVEADQRKRREEEEEQQRKKDEQRRKAERLEENRRREDQRRKEQLQEDYKRKQEIFLQAVERRRAPDPLASSGATHTSYTTKVNKQPRGVGGGAQPHYARMNSAFLETLPLGSDEEKAKDEEKVKEERRRSAVLKPSAAWSELPVVAPPTTLLRSAQLDPKPGRTQSHGAEVDSDWALMKLRSLFPDVSRSFLEEILLQCRGDFEEACTLLVCSLT